MTGRTVQRLEARKQWERMEVLACAALDRNLPIEVRKGWRTMDTLACVAIEHGYKYWDFPGC